MKSNHNSGLIIIGASGHGRVIADIALKMNVYKNIYFIDDNEDIKESMGIEVIGNSKSISKHINKFDMFVAIGNNTTREKVQTSLLEAGAQIPALIHPNAIIAEKVIIGAGTAVMAGAIINSLSIIGQGCIINTGATIDHDNKIDDFVHISPGVHTAGTVTVGRGTWLGIGAVVSNNINITGNCIIGAGAVVIRDIMAQGIYIGVPASKLS